MNAWMIRALGAIACIGAAAGCLAGEVLYNGIVLPSDWPPKVTWEDIKARKPISEPPYLKQPPEVIPIDVGRQLFVDDFLIHETTLRRTFHQAEYHPSNPVFTGGMPFSGGVFWDPKDQRIKMWYHGAGGTGYTTSKDGIHWEPGRIVLPGSSDSQCVWLDLEEPDPAKRYKMTRSVVADNRCRGWIYFSADGIDWRHVGYTGDWGDRSTFFWNPFRKLWVMSCRHGWGQPRARRYWEVKDMEKGPYWRSAGQPDYAPFWIGADSLDPSRPDYKINPELYNLDAAGYESLMLGMFSIWRGQPPPREKPNEVCVGFSRDGFHWTRPDRRPFCAVSETPGTWNYANVQSAAGACLVMGDRLYFYVERPGQGARGRPGHAAARRIRLHGRRRRRRRPDHSGRYLQRQIPFRESGRPAGGATGRDSRRRRPADPAVYAGELPAAPGRSYVGPDPLDGRNRPLRAGGEEGAVPVPPQGRQALRLLGQPGRIRRQPRLRRGGRAGVYQQQGHGWKA